MNMINAAVYTSTMKHLQFTFKQITFEAQILALFLLN